MVFIRFRRANPVWLDPFCHNLELANQADHEDDLPENLSEITDLWNSPARTHVRQSEQEARPCVKCAESPSVSVGEGGAGTFYADVVYC